MPRLGFVGFGNMGEAIARAAASGGVVKAEEVSAFDPREERVSSARGLGFSAAASNAELAEGCDILVLAVKPQEMEDALKGLGDCSGKLVISIAAGVNLARIETSLPGARVVRAMPNTPLQVASGVTGVARGKLATDADAEFARGLFGSSGEVVELDEGLLDAVTAVSGSGPAYAFYLVEAMVEAGIAEGLTREDALTLASCAVRGAGELLLKTGKEPEELRRMVTSPGGTTQAAIETMEASGVKEALVRAVRRAAMRSRELSG